MLVHCAAFTPRLARTQAAVFLLMSVFVLLVPRGAQAQAWSFGDWQGHWRTSYLPSWVPGAALCAASVTSAMDSELSAIRTTPSVQARVANIVRTSAYGWGTILGIFDAGLVVNPDASLIGGDEELEEMADIYLADANAVAMAMGWGATLVGVPDYSGTNEDAIVVLNSDGDVHVFAREQSGILPAASLPWPAGYELASTLSPPSLPAGTTVRHYCDVEMLADGDVVVTFAQNPTYSLSGSTYLREGYIRYDRAAGAWETPVTTIAGFTLLHPAKTGAFARQSCISVDYNRSLGRLGFSVNLDSAGLRRVWLVTYSTSGAFAFFDAVEIDSPATYGDVEDVALLDANHFLVQQDNSGADRIRLWSDTSVTHLDEASVVSDLNGLSVSKVNDGDGTCVEWIVYASVQQSTSYPVGADCASFMSVPLERCP